MESYCVGNSTRLEHPMRRTIMDALSWTRYHGRAFDVHLEVR